jgi:hypothetical protein
LFPKSIVETAVGKLTSIITTFSVQNMQLKEGDDVLVMIKATEAMIEKHGTEAVWYENKVRSIFFGGACNLRPFVRAEQLQVFAAASLTDALKEIAPAYEAASGGKLQFNFAGSTALARQIQEGRLMSSSRPTKRRWTPFKRLGRF